MQSNSTVTQIDHIWITNAKEAIDKLYAIDAIKESSLVSIGISTEMKDSSNSQSKREFQFVICPLHICLLEQKTKPGRYQTNVIGTVFPWTFCVCSTNIAEHAIRPKQLKLKRVQLNNKHR